MTSSSDPNSNQQPPIEALKSDVVAWNKWRHEHTGFLVDLYSVNLSGIDLRSANLFRADLSGSDLSGVDLTGADLSGAKVDSVMLGWTKLVDIDLSAFTEAEAQHSGPSVVDHSSIAKSLHCPNLLRFLTDTGMPLIVASYAIDSVRTLDPNGLFNLMHSTFISYGGPDEAFAVKLQDALQMNGVTTFLFANDAGLGEPLADVMRTGIREHDRVVLICSENSLNREGVLNEIELTLRREAKEGGQALLIPIATDRYVFDGWDPQNKNLKEAVLERVIGDFSDADTDDAKLDLGISRLLKALRVDPIQSD